MWLHIAMSEIRILYRNEEGEKMEILVIIWLLCGVLCYFIMKSKG